MICHRAESSDSPKIGRDGKESSDSPKIGWNTNRPLSNSDLNITRSRTSSMSSAYSSLDFGSPRSITSSKKMYTGPEDFGPPWAATLSIWFCTCYIRAWHDDSLFGLDWIGLDCDPRWSKMWHYGEKGDTTRLRITSRCYLNLCTISDERWHQWLRLPSLEIALRDIEDLSTLLLRVINRSQSAAHLLDCTSARPIVHEWCTQVCFTT
jgi:hypothetical protein